MAHDLRVILWLAAGKGAPPIAAVLEGCNLQNSPAKADRVSATTARSLAKAQMAVDILGHLLSLKVIATSEQKSSGGWTHDP